VKPSTGHIRHRIDTLTAPPSRSALHSLTRDGWLLFLTRFTRLFAYGSLSVVLVFYLTAIGLSEFQVGMLLTLTLAGDVVVSLSLTTRADRIGRRRMLIIGALLMAGAVGGVPYSHSGIKQKLIERGYTPDQELEDSAKL
jgi:MFS family permease